MPRPMNRLFSAILSAAMIILCSTPELRADFPQKDVLEANNYAFTLKKIDQFSLATKNLIVASQKNPNVLGNDTREKAELDGLAGLEQAFEKLPEAKKAIQDAGMSVREYWTFQIAMIYAAAGNLVLKSGGKLPPEYSRQNVEFFKTHEADFMKLDKDMKALQELSESQSSDEEDYDDESEEEE